MRFIFYLLLSVTSIAIFPQTTKIVNVSTAGTLANLISAAEENTLINLSVSGNLDARDFAFMRDRVKNLSVLNIASSSIKAYSGSDGTHIGINKSYPAGELPAYAFYNPVTGTFKSSLTSISLPTTLVSIGDLAFYFNWNLSGISIPTSVKSISTYAFYGCYAMTSISVSSSNTRYSAASGVLFNKAQDTLFIFPNAKQGNYSIPATVKHIATSAFENCYELTNITFPSSLLSIGSYAFSYCSGINGNLTLPSGLKKLEDGAFYGCYNLTGTVTIPASLTDIGYYCFLESNNIKSFSVNTANPDYAGFNDALFSKNLDTLFICPGVKTGSFIIPATVKLIGSYAFYNCKYLTGSITIPAATDYIGYYAFYGCSQISSYLTEPGNVYFLGLNNLLYSRNLDRLIACPQQYSGTLLIPEGLREIDPGALNNCSGISGTIHLPASLSLIGAYAFYNCSGINGFSVDSNNQYFSATDGLLLSKNADTLYICPLSKPGSLTLPPGLVHLGTSSLDGCINLNYIQFPSGLQSIGNYALRNCTGLNSITLYNQIKQIGYAAFYGNSSLRSFGIDLPTPLLIDYYAFELIDKNLCTLYVPQGSENIYRNAPYWEGFTQITGTSFNSQIDLNSIQNVRFSSYAGVIQLSNLQPGQMLKIYTLSGICVFAKSTTTESMLIPFERKGIFILQIGDFTEKVIL
jgi:hypothetical protein